jgi:hypothetical protein
MVSSDSRLQIASGLFDFLTANDAFLASLVEAATETLGLVNQARLQVEPNLALLRELKATWITIATSKHFLIPGKHRSDLKRLCLLVLVDVATLTASPSAENLDTISVLLREIIEKAEKLLHGDPSKLVKAALASTTTFLAAIDQPVAVSKYSHGKNIPNPINLWAECRRLSQNTNPDLYLHSCNFLHFCSQLARLQRRPTAIDVEFVAARLNAIASLKAEIRLVEHYFRQQRLRSLTLYAKRAAAPFALLALCFVPFGLFDFASSSENSLDRERFSDGESVLTPDQRLYTDQLPAPCHVNRTIKLNATRAYASKPPQLSQAITLIRQYLSFCPDDAEAQIYLNNYTALLDKRSLGSQRPIVKLAVVVPLLRRNGIRDSYEILRGIGLAQDKLNRKPEDSIRAQPLILIQIHNDALMPVTTRSDTEEAKGRIARQTALSIVAYADRARRDPPVVGVIGHFSSGSTEAASRDYNNYGMPVISPTSTNLRESLANPRYLLAPPPALHHFLSLLPADFADNLLSNYGLLRRRLETSILASWSVRPGRLDLDPNIFRVSPTDEDSQNRFLEYLSRYNANSENQIRKLVVISELRETSKYSHNYLLSLERLARKEAGANYEISHRSCQYYPSSSTIYDPEGCRSEILRNPEEAKALIVVTSSNTVGDAIDFVKGVLRDHPIRSNLLVIGADSLMSKYLTDTDSDTSLFSGTVITSAAREVEAFFPLGFKPLPPMQQKRIRLTWRTQMSYDSVVVFASFLSNALRSGVRDGDVNGLKKYLLANIPRPAVPGSDVVDSPDGFHPGTHDRDISAKSSLNLLLCASRSASGSLYFRDLDSSKVTFCRP